MSAQPRPRYTTLQRHLHWWMALLVVLAYVLIEQRGLFPRGSGGRTAMMQGHFWAGITIFLLALWRIATRRRHGAPPITPALDGFTALTSRLMHLALYAFFIVMPLLGMAAAWSDGKAIMIPFTGVALPALLPENKPLAHTLEDIHGTIGDIFYWVIGLHVLAALYHHWVRRDDTLKRML
ncbi:MAG: cytochrome b [Xanthomonadales bacterium]|nr:cytochrome b [Xanthomonadales bacterium]MBN8795930.1 cytochrome b [Stenotrophomonas nitritireducens]